MQNSNSNIGFLNRQDHNLMRTCNEFRTSSRDQNAPRQSSVTGYSNQIQYDPRNPNGGPRNPNGVGISSRNWNYPHQTRASAGSTYQSVDSDFEDSNFSTVSELERDPYLLGVSWPHRIPRPARGRGFRPLGNSGLTISKPFSEARTLLG